MTASRILKLVTGAFEATLAIPIIGGLIVIATGYYALLIMLVFHVITLILSARDKGAIAGSILGIVASLFGIIPFLGWLLHLLAAIFLFIGGATKNKIINQQVIDSN